MKYLIWIGLMASLATSSGCAGARWFQYVFGLEEKETIVAEFDELAHSSAAVIVYCDESIQIRYPQEALRLSSICTGHLKQNVPGIKVRDSLIVGRFVHETLHWDTMPKNEICDILKVDYLVLIALEEFSTRGDSGRESYQTRIVGEVKVYPRDGGEEDNPDWSSRDSIRVVWPKAGAVFDKRAEVNNMKIAENKFGSKVAKLFYDYEQVLETKRGKK
jgi:hypothetical protein